VPESTTAHVGCAGVAAFALADQLIDAPLSVPVAVPATFRSPAHDALNEPFAEFAVCSVGFHLKSVHVDGAGIRLALTDAQLPIRAATLVELGAVEVVLLEYPTQPEAAAAKHRIVARRQFFIQFCVWKTWSCGGENYTTRTPSR